MTQLTKQTKSTLNNSTKTKPPQQKQFNNKL